MKGKISKQSVENMSCGTKDRFLWDTELPMFGCKITPKGRRVYLLQYRINRRQRRYTIGTHGVLTAKEARNIARNLMHELVLGHDPVDAKNKKEDIPLLIEHFMQNYPSSKNLPTITAAVMEALTFYDWPGNVRELTNTLHRYLTLEKLDFLDTSLIDDSQTEPPVSVEERETNESLDATVKRLEKLYLTRVLEDNDWHQGKVSTLLKVDRKTLYRKIIQYHLKPS